MMVCRSPESIERRRAWQREYMRRKLATRDGRAKNLAAWQKLMADPIKHEMDLARRRMALHANPAAQKRKLELKRISRAKDPEKHRAADRRRYARRKMLERLVADI